MSEYSLGGVISDTGVVTKDSLLSAAPQTERPREASADLIDRKDLFVNVPLWAWLAVLGVVLVMLVLAVDLFAALRAPSGGPKRDQGSRMAENPLESYNSGAITTRWWGGYGRADVDSHIDTLRQELEKLRGIIGDERSGREQAEREAAALRGELEQAYVQVDGLHEVNKQVVGENEYWREKLRDADHFMPEDVGDMAPLLAELWEGARRGVEAASVRAINWEQRKAEEHDLAKEAWARMTEELAADLVVKRAEAEAELAQLGADTNAEMAKQRQVAQEYDSRVRADADQYRQATVARTRDEVQYWLNVRAELVASLDELAAGLEAARKAQCESFRQLTDNGITHVQ